MEGWPSISKTIWPFVQLGVLIGHCQWIPSRKEKWFLGGNPFGMVLCLKGTPYFYKFLLDKAANALFPFFCLSFFFFFWLCLWHADISWPGIEPVLQQWQHKSLYLANHQGNSPFTFLMLGFFPLETHSNYFLLCECWWMTTIHLDHYYYPRIWNHPYYWCQTLKKKLGEWEKYMRMGWC